MNIKILPVGELGTNCYILEDEVSKLAAVIDPGDEAGRILDQVKKDGVQVKYILLTHGHYDHTTAVPQLHEALPDAEIYIHQADSHGAGGRLFPLSSQVDDLLLYDEGDVLKLGELTIQVMNTPGHSLGSVVLKVGDVLFTGDTLFAGSCGRTDLRGGDYGQMLASLKRLALLDGDYHVLPGHDVSSTLARERQTNYYMKEALSQP
ncbi:MAG: MBL fold metallo-hydrolase [Ruminococcaceae bacterium]|nr:MBL fold metallo-hydrolase [Oscillospiraceae bacterium]